MDDPELTSVSLDTRTPEILLLASRHDISGLKPYLRSHPGSASVQDAETGMTPLHAAIGVCERDPGEAEMTETEIEKASEMVKELFLAGAIWNDLDANGETPGCVAWRIGRRELYELVVQAGVRAELLLNLMGGWEELGSDGDEAEDGEGEGKEEEKNGADGGENGIEADTATATAAQPTTTIAKEFTNDSSAKEDKDQEEEINPATYLTSSLTFTTTKLLDASKNGVMMSWETPIMTRTAALLAPTPGLRILNVGFGMGIIDSLFAATKPSVHHIIEAHPAVLEYMQRPSPSQPSSEGKEEGKEEFIPNASWSATGPEEGAYAILPGRWQDILPTLLSKNETYDVIYFDTFSESYTQLQEFFTEYVIALLSPDGRFGFFNGLGADRRVCYDVYCRVVEVHLADAGLDVEWVDVPVEMEELEKEGEGEWEGVKRRYWTLDRYRLPVCRFLGS